MSVTIGPIGAATTHDLRRSVLRDGAADAQVDWPRDHDDDTFHIGAVLDGRVVAVSTWIAEPFPNAPGEAAYQLRGMATDPAHAGSGLGSLVLTAGCEAARSRGVATVWANARVTALTFYQRAGFVASGPIFTTPATGLPHQLICRRV